MEHVKNLCLRRPTILRSFVHATRQVLLLDECSMLDKMCFFGIQDALSCVDDTRRPEARTSDPFGSVSLILFGDFKQEPCFLIHSRIGGPTPLSFPGVSNVTPCFSPWAVKVGRCLPMPPNASSKERSPVAAREFGAALDHYPEYGRDL